MILQFTIPDTQANRFIDVLCKQYGYQAEFADILGNVTPNTETKGQFAKRMTGQILVSVVKDMETRQTVQGVADTVTALTIT